MIDNNNCGCDILCEILSKLFEQVDAGKISPGLVDCNNNKLKQGDKILTCELYSKDKSDFLLQYKDDVKNLNDILNDELKNLANQNDDYYKKLNEYFTKLFLTSKEIIHDDSLAGSGVCGNSLSINESYINALLHELLYMDQNSIIGKGTKDNPYYVNPTWFNEGFDQDSIKGDRNSTISANKLHINPDWIYSIIHTGNGINGDGSIEKPLGINPEWIASLFDSDVINWKHESGEDLTIQSHWFGQRFSEDDFRVKDDPNDRDYPIISIRYDTIEGSDVNSIISKSNSPELPTQMFGNRGSLMGRPDAWIKIEKLGLVIPAYKYVTGV